jgi:hypothetical protein
MSLLEVAIEANEYCKNKSSNKFEKATIWFIYSDDNGSKKYSSSMYKTHAIPEDFNGIINIHKQHHSIISMCIEIFYDDDEGKMFIY